MLWYCRNAIAMTLNVLMLAIRYVGKRRIKCTLPIAILY